MARSGYLNLLQAQDRRSKNPGDTKKAMLARRRLYDRSVTKPLLEGIQAMLNVSRHDATLDVGCGDGFYLGSIAEASGCSAHGVDISVPSIEAAVKRYAQCQWIVANADRFIPYSDRLFSRVFTITARMNPPEFRRVLADDGLLLVAVPSPTDLIELRGKGRDRSERTIAEFAPHFTLIERRTIETTADLDISGVEDVLAAIYRPLRSKPVEPMRLTLSLDALMFQKI